jgi:hypothetical protein
MLSKVCYYKNSTVVVNVRGNMIGGMYKIKYLMFYCEGEL